MKKTALAVFIACLIAGCGGGSEEPVDSETLARLKTYVETHPMSPADFILDKFTDHDVIFLGEVHRVKHDVALVRDLLPLLYEHGIYSLGTEFGRRIDQDLIDSLLGLDGDNEFVIYTAAVGSIA